MAAAIRYPRHASRSWESERRRRNDHLTPLHRALAEGGVPGEIRTHDLPAANEVVIGCAFPSPTPTVEIAIVQIRSAPSPSEAGRSTRRYYEKKDWSRVALSRRGNLLGLGDRRRIQIAQCWHSIDRCMAKNPVETVLRSSCTQSEALTAVRSLGACAPAPLCSHHVRLQPPLLRCQRDQARLLIPPHRPEPISFRRQHKPRYYGCARAQNPSEIMCIKRAPLGGGRHANHPFFNIGCTRWYRCRACIPGR
jgi:hypothetical protein